MNVRNQDDAVGHLHQEKELLEHTCGVGLFNQLDDNF